MALAGRYLYMTPLLSTLYDICFMKDSWHARAFGKPITYYTIEFS